MRLGRWNVSWLLPLVLLLVIALVDSNTAGNVRIISWIVLVPGIAAALCGVVVTSLFGAAAVGLYVLLEQARRYDYQQGAVDFWLVVAGGLLAVLASWLRGRASDLLKRVEDAADATRLAVLRPIPPGAGGLDSASAYLTADIAAQVGGDFFDIQPSPHGARVLLGDVQGKGTSAVDAAAALLSAFREHGYYERDLATVAERLDIRMRRHNRYTSELGHQEERFATAVLVGFPVADTGWVELVNFGHPGPLALGGSGGVRALPEGDGPPLGLVGIGAGDARADTPRVRRVPFETEETLLLFSDGVTEARDKGGTFLPLTDRLTEGPLDLAPRAVVERVERAVLAHTRGRLGDDTAIMAVRRTGRPDMGGYPPMPPPGITRPDS